MGKGYIWCIILLFLCYKILVEINKTIDELAMNLGLIRQILLITLLLKLL